MKISLNWLSSYLDIPVSADELSIILTNLGLEVEGMEQVESISGGLRGLTVGEVVECGQHPNADRLSLTKVNVGQEDLLQIVCGAPNVAKGQKVVVATVGTELFPSDGDPFKIKKGKIRGEVSEGMICAEDEIGIGTDHDGIIVLPETIDIGTPASEYYKIEVDTIYDIGLTPNRSDATSHIGVARDLAAYFKYHGISAGEVKLPDTAALDLSSTESPIEVEIQDLAGSPRFSGIVLENVKVKPSPSWMQNKLKAIGVRPISNIVDITNFVLHEMGQPLHAYDADKITGDKIIVRTLAKDAIFKSLDEVDRKLQDTDVMVCNGNSEGMCIGGVFGGLESGVKDETSRIFLEAAHFNAKRIRKTSTYHNLRTDAAMRFEKGSDPSITIAALQRAALLMVEYGEAKVSSKIVDHYPSPIAPKSIPVRYDQVNKIIGNDISSADIKKILKAMDIKITEESDAGLTVEIPTNKADVVREIDVIEEILRIYGFNNVKIDDKIKSSIVYSDRGDKSKTRDMIAHFLSSKGYDEMMNLSLSESTMYNKYYDMDDKDMVIINNTSNVHLNIMRADSLLPTLSTISYNQNRQQGDVNFFEMGRSYQMKDGSPAEKEFLILALKGNFEGQNWISGKVTSDFYVIKQHVEELLHKLGITSYQKSELEEDPRFGFGMKYHQGPREIVKFGEVSDKLISGFDLRGEVYFAEFDLGILAQMVGKNRVVMQEISKFPSTKRDLALILDNHVAFQDVVAVAKSTDKKMIKDISLFDVYKNEDQIGKDKKSYAVSFTFEDRTKTLKDKEVDKVFKKLIANYEQKLNAIVRK